ncbi:MAG TPA: hypothetical protein PLW44_07515 [Chitinophagales bacterium]|nr:hypothetical protein [Chitinophagales bacterium]
MDTTRNTLTADKSMEIIQSMIATAKNNLKDDGFHFLLWGVLVILASLAQYYLAVVAEYPNNFLPWMVMPVIGVPAALIYEWQKKKTEKVKTLFDQVFSWLWLAVGVCMFLVIYISVSNHIPPVPFIMAIVGVGTFVSGTILRFKMLVAGGIIFWLGAFVCTLTTPVNQLLVNAAATFLGYIMPGIMLWKDYKKENHV